MSRSTLVLAALLVIAAVAASAAAQPVTVMVNTTSGAIDGNTANIELLKLSPGFDGVISLMEAIEAANNTFGPKTIAFSAALGGKSIPFGSNDLADIRRFSLKSGDLTIDGDVDGDGSADVALDATGRDLATIHVRSSNIVIRNLIFREFGSQAINFACEDVECKERTISNVRIADNLFESQRGGAVEIGVWGLLGPSNVPFLSNFVFENIVIDHNTIRGPVESFADGIGARVCSDGVANSRYTGVYITNNSIRVHTAIDASAADEALPPYYSDNCVLENLVIDGNLIEDAATGIYLDSSNLGNQHNMARHIRITNNRILRSTNGMRIGAANLPNPTRSTSFNVMSDLLISGNEIADSSRAILLTAGNWPLNNVAPTAVDDNTLTGAAIIGNNIHGYRGAGLQVFGAVAASSSGAHTSSRNRIDGLTIAGNTFEAAAGEFIVGVEIVGGQSNGPTAAANEIRHLNITGNTFRNNRVGLSLIGGRHPGSTGNLLSIAAMSPNRFEQNFQDVVTMVDAEGATGNRIEITGRRRPALH